MGHMKKLALCVLALLVLLAGALVLGAAAMPAAAQESGSPDAEGDKRLLIATTDNGPVSIDRLLYLSMRNTGYNVDFISPVIREGYIQANEGTCDGVIAGYPGLETQYPNLIPVPVTLERINVRVFAREGSDLSINSWDELDGMSVGILENRTYILERLPENVTITEKETNRTVLDGLVNSEYDVAILVERDHEIVGETLRITRVGVVDTLYDTLYMNKKHEEYIPELTTALENLFKTGAADQLLSNVPLAELNQKRTIVHIISSSVEISRQDRFTTELRRRFEDDMSLEWITVNLDARRFTRGQHNMAFIASLLRADIVSRNVSAVLVSGDTALDFLDNYYYLYFRGTPVLFYGTSEEYASIIRDDEHRFTGIVQNIEARATVDKALEMFPGTTDVFVLNDYTDEGLQYRAAIEEDLQGYSGVNIEYNDNEDIATLLERVSHLRDGTIVLVGSYFVDADHQYYTMGEMKRLMDRNCDVPIFSLFSIDPPFNAVGGKCLDFQMLGGEIADMLEYILDGGSVDDIPIVHDSTYLNRWVFDQVQLDRFGIKADSLPEDSLIVNRVLPVWESNPQFFVTMVVLLIIGTALIIGTFAFITVNHRHSRQKDKLQQALSIEKSMLETLFNSVPELMCVKDLDGRLHRVNKQFAEHFGINPEEVEGKSDSIMAAMPEDFKEALREADKTLLSEDRLVMFEQNIPGIDGSNPYYEIIETPLRSADGILGIVGIAYNITHRKEMEEAAQAASRAKSNFLANMSHEMRTPLTTVLGLTELIIETVRLDDETLSNLIKIYRAGETLLGLVNDVLDISKIEADKFALNEHEYELPSLINDTITQCSLYIGEKPIKFNLNISKDLPNYLYGDDLRIRQMWNNLLSNAFKFTMRGTVELGISAEREESGAVRLKAWVSDTGIGIRRADLDKLFTMYSKLNEEENGESKNASRRTEGTGLGLSITKRVAEMMNGSVSVESEYGKGSTFTVTVLQKSVGDAVIGEEIAENLRTYDYSFRKFENAKMTRINLSYARVLVVDDNHTNLDVARGLMSLYGMAVDCVDNGKEAVEAIRDENVVYNAIFMDHMMPGMDGIEAARQIREEIGTDYAKNIPIIALTANAIVGNEEMFLDCGFQAFISKPIDLAKLDAALRRWVRDRDAESLLPERTILIQSSNMKSEPLLKIGIPGLDISKGITHFGKDADTYINVLSSYAKNTKPLLEKIKEVSAETLSEYTVIVHGIKGSSFGIFADEAGRKASSMEKAAAAGDLEYVLTNNPGFLDIVSHLIDDIEKAISESVSKPEKDYPDKEQLKKFLDACEHYNIDEMDEAMREIEKWNYTGDDGLAEWLHTNLRQGQYKAIRERLSEPGFLD